MIVKVVVPDSIYARVYFARGEQGPQGNTGAQGVQGPTGATGATGATGTSYTPGDPIYVTVRNATGASMAKGTIVYTSGGNGTHTQVSPALATSDATSARVLGWLAESIANNASGLCQVEGYLDGIDTQGIAEGTQLYVSGTTAGSFQTTKPVAPIHLVYAGVVVKASAGNGRVYVKVQNGYELDEIHDVLISSPANNEVLTYETSTGLWKNKSNPADGVTSITATSPLTGGTITSTGSIGIDQTALAITQSQVTGLVTALAGTAKLGTANAFSVGGHVITAEAIGVIPMVLKGASGQTASLQQWQEFGTTPSQVNSTGQFRIRTFANSVGFTALGVGAGASTELGIVVRGASSQSADMIEIHDNSANILAGISATGRIVSGVSQTTSLGSLNLGLVNTQPQQLAVVAREVGTVGAVIRGAASATANLTEWQNSGGTVLTRIEPTGNIVVPGNAGAISNNQFILGTRNSGGELTLVRQTTASAAPGTNLGRLYFRTGTTGLKLVAMGPTGTEITIADNIT